MKRYLITGGSSGVGLAVARLLVSSGERVLLVGRDPKKLNAACFELGPHCDARIENLRDSASEIAHSWREGFSTDPFDGIVHAAGVEVVAPSHVTAFSQSDTAPLNGLVAISRCARHILTKDASVVVMSSIAAHRGYPATMLYGAQKAAIESAVRVLAIEWAPTYRINAVVAGAFHSPMHDRVTVGMSRETLQEYEARHPLGFGRIEDVVFPICFLLSEGARWITGTTMVVDGGCLAKG